MRKLAVPTRCRIVRAEGTLLHFHILTNLTTTEGFYSYLTDVNLSPRGGGPAIAIPLRTCYAFIDIFSDILSAVTREQLVEYGARPSTPQVIFTPISPDRLRIRYTES